MNIWGCNMQSNIEILKDTLDQIDIKNGFQTMPDGTESFTFIVPVNKKEWPFIVDTYKNTNQLRLRTFYLAPASLSKQQLYKAINDVNKELPYFKLFYQESQQGNFIFVMYTIPNLAGGLKIYFLNVLKAFCNIADKL